MPQHCTEFFTLPASCLVLPQAERKQVIKALVKHADDKFAPNQLACQSPISFLEEAVVMMFFAILMGGPMLLIFSGWMLAVFGSWLQCFAWLLVAAALMFHPLPDMAKAINESWFALALFKYFSYRFVWSDKDDELSAAAPAWFGAGPPHGVLPLANLLSIPAINIAVRPFVGAPASVVFRTPFLRYMTLFGAVDVSGRSMARATSKGICVGIVPDGIAGIFKCRDQDEVVYLKNRKGLAKLALKTGTPLLPAYSIGNTAVFGAWFDPFGIMEFFSRKAQTSLFIFWGRFGLPLPRRVNITMLFGKPIVPQKIEEPTPEQVDALHQQYLAAIEELFNKHKAALGWEHKSIRFV